MKTLKLLASLAVALLFCTDLSAQNCYSNVELFFSKKSDGIFKKNEKVEVCAIREEADGNELLLTVTVNGKKVKDKEPLELKPGKKVKVLSESYSEPSAVVVTVSPASSKNRTAIGFIVAPEEFKPGFDEPADFTGFWEKQIAALRASEMDVKLTPVEIPEEQAKYRTRVEVFDLEISMPEGNPVHAYIGWPKAAEEKSLGIEICPHGSGVRSSSLLNVIWKSYGHKAIVIDINAHGVVNGESKEFYEALNKGELKDYRTRKCTGHEDFYFRLMYLRMQRVLDYACTLPLWDGDRVAVDGTSQGGGQALALAGMDPRVKLALVQVPALTDIGGNFAGHSGGWPYYGKFKDSRDGDYKTVFAYYDGANFIRHTGAKLVMEAGLCDVTCAPECVWAAYNVAASSDKKIYAFPYREHMSKRMSEASYSDWKESIDVPRRAELDKYLKH